MASPMDSGSPARTSPSGMRGWLLLFALGALVTSVLHLMWAAVLHSFVPNVPQPDRVNSFPDHDAFVASGNTLASVLLFAAAVGFALFFLVFLRHHSTPRYVRIGLVALMGAQLVCPLIPTLLGVHAHRLSLFFALYGAVSITIELLWFFYFVRSVRVLNTYGPI